MKIAFIIANKEGMQIGECLSSAVLFEVFDSAVKSFYDLSIDKPEEHINLAQKISEFLKKHEVDYVVGKDLGPKAKAAIEDNKMRWFIASTNDRKEIINLIKKKNNE